MYLISFTFKRLHLPEVQIDGGPAFQPDGQHFRKARAYNRRRVQNHVLASRLLFRRNHTEDNQELQGKTLYGLHLGVLEQGADYERCHPVKVDGQDAGV